MKTTLLLMSLAALALAPASAAAQDLSARLVGFERADAVAGTVTVSDDRSTVLVSGLSSAYGRTLEIHLARGFDRATVARVGEVPSGTGDMTFELTGGAAVGADTVLVTVSGLTAPIGVGLLK